MSSIIHVSTWFSPQYRAAGMAATLQRLLERSTYRFAERGIEPHAAQAVVLEIDRNGLEDRLDEALGSHEVLSLHFGYRLLGGRELGVSVHIVGCKSRSRISNWGPGTLQASFAFADLVEGLNELRYGKHPRETVIFDFMDDPALMTPVLVDSFGEMGTERVCVMEDATELFLRLCGMIGTPSDQSLMTAAMCADDVDWRTPDHCNMMYHRSVAEFGRDLVRLYASSRWCDEMARMLDPALDLWSLEHSGDHAQYRQQRAELRQRLDEKRDPFTVESLECVRFLDRLDRRAVARVGSLADDEVRLLLSATQETMATELHDFGHRGAALCDAPRSGLLWRAYRAMYDTFRSEWR